MGSDIINPVWPLFVTQVLKANMAALGFLDGLGEAIVSLSQAVAGYYSDRIRKRKVFIWTGYLCGAVSRLGYAASSVWQHLIPFRILDRAGKIRGAPRDAIARRRLDRREPGPPLRPAPGHGQLGRPSPASSSPSPSSTSSATGSSSPWPPSPPSLGAVAHPEEHQGSRSRPWPASSRACRSRTSTATSRSTSPSTPSSPWAPSPIRSCSSTPRSEGFKTGFIPVLYPRLLRPSPRFLSYPFGRLSDRIGRKPVMFMAYGAWAAVCAGVVFFGTGAVPSPPRSSSSTASTRPPSTRSRRRSPPSSRRSPTGPPSWGIPDGHRALAPSRPRSSPGLLWDKVGQTGALLSFAGIDGGRGPAAHLRQGDAPPGGDRADLPPVT
ncbi:MAG: hypothetical protein M0C28_04165 [Candidatus Moduliflexus flocculans]|nr:hypothetical protein [Candidatus Moduliflexus flocculans]